MISTELVGLLFVVAGMLLCFGMISGHFKLKSMQN